MTKRAGDKRLPFVTYPFGRCLRYYAVNVSLNVNKHTLRIEP